MKFSHLMPFAAALMLSTAAVAQDTTQPTPANPPAATDPAPTTPSPGPAPSELPSATPAPAEIPAPRAETTTTPVLTDDQAHALKNKVVWSSDQMNVGEVADVARDRDGRIQELHADIGGFLGFGETRVRVTPDEFRMMDDRAGRAAAQGHRELAITYDCRLHGVRYGAGCTAALMNSGEAVLWRVVSNFAVQRGRARNGAGACL